MWVKCDIQKGKPIYLAFSYLVYNEKSQWNEELKKFCISPLGLVSKAKSTLPDESALGNDPQPVGKVVHTYLFMLFSVAGQCRVEGVNFGSVCSVLSFSSGPHSELTPRLHLISALKGVRRFVPKEVPVAKQRFCSVGAQRTPDPVVSRRGQLPSCVGVL